MLDFELTEDNLVRQDSTKVDLKGARVNVEYKLHRQELRNPADPEGNPIELWCLHVPQIEAAYVDKSEELVFEALHEFFGEDFIRHYATRLVEERKKTQE